VKALAKRVEENHGSGEDANAGLHIATTRADGTKIINNWNFGFTRRRALGMLRKPVANKNFGVAKPGHRGKLSNLSRGCGRAG
jgi:hypothetical protein